MNKKTLFSCLLFSLLGTNQALAVDGQDAASDSVKFGVGFAGNLIQAGEGYDEYHGYEVSLGYIYQDSFKIESGFSRLNSQDDVSPDNIFVRSSKIFTLSDYASYYLGGGINYLHSDLYPGLNAGILYGLDKHWYIDAGYQALISDTNEHIYSLLISVNYKLPVNAQPAEKTEVVVTSRPVNDVAEPVQIKPKKKTPYYRYYTVVKGDNMIFIARRLGVPLHELVLANPQLALKRKTIDLIYPNERIYYRSEDSTNL